MVTSWYRSQVQLGPSCKYSISAKKNEEGRGPQPAEYRRLQRKPVNRKRGSAGLAQQLINKDYCKWTCGEGVGATTLFLKHPAAYSAIITLDSKFLGSASCIYFASGNKSAIYEIIPLAQSRTTESAILGSRGPYPHSG